MLQNTLQRIKDADYVALAKQAFEFSKTSLARAVKFDHEKTTDLGELWGTPVAARPSTVLLAALATAFYGIAVVPIAFVSLMLHEYAHIFRGRAHGIKTQRVLLTGVGGAAEMVMDAEDQIFLTKPRVEWEVGLVGPMASFALAAFGYFTAAVLALLSIPSETMLLFGQVNLVLGAFNMFPMMPMDGGRVVRGLILDGKSWHAKGEAIDSAERLSASLIGVAATIMPVVPFISAYLLAGYRGHKQDLKQARLFCEWKAGKEPLPIDEAAINNGSWWRGLGLSSAPSSLKEVKLAYRKMALIHHPDKGGRPGAMRRVAEAYDIGKAKFG